MKFTLLFCIASLALAQDQQLYDSIIIGAGWAGMSAARILKEAGQENFLILEAQDRIGGRTWTSYEFGEDIPVDMGSISLDSTDTHPLFQIINQTTITPKDQIAMPAVISSNGTVFDEDFYNSKLKQYWEEFYGPTDGFEDNRDELYNASFHYDNYWAAWANIDQFDDDMYYTQYFLEDGNLEDFINLFVEEKGIPEGEEDLGFFMMLVERWITSEYAGSTSDMSELFWEEDSWYKGPSYFINMKMNMKQRVKNPPRKITVGTGGWKLLVDVWSEPILDKIQMNSKVIHIDYGEDPVLVTYEGSDGSTTSLAAKTVVCTIPIGVLKTGDVEFFPTLNDDSNYRENATEWVKKDYAMDKIGPGKIIHVALYWEGMTDDEVFWPDDDWIQFIAPEIESQGRLTQWLNLYRINGGIPILMGTVNGNHVDDMVDMTDREVVDEAVKKLRSIFGDDVPSPTQFIVKNWLKDEFAKGAYSYDRPDAFYPRWYLGKSLPGRFAPDNRLIFAGEATSEPSFGTTHGAIFEGQRAGAEVLENLLYEEDSEGLIAVFQTVLETFNDFLDAFTELIRIVTALFSTEGE